MKKQSAANTIFKPTQTRIFRKKYVNGSVNSEGHLKKLKTRCDAYFLSIFVIKSSIQLVRESLEDENIFSPALAGKHAAWKQAIKVEGKVLQSLLDTKVPLSFLFNTFPCKGELSVYRDRNN
jgi:hypothetical protein